MSDPQETPQADAGMFHPMEGMGTAEKYNENVREVVGDGTPYLRVPGLKKLMSIRVGNADLPLQIEQEFPTDHTLRRLKTVTTPLVKQAAAPDGTPVLLRSLQSHDGVWQRDERIYIEGEWEKEKAKA